jgi:hypothetical protein
MKFRHKSRFMTIFHWSMTKITVIDRHIFCSVRSSDWPQWRTGWRGLELEVAPPSAAEVRNSASPLAPLGPRGGRIYQRRSSLTQAVLLLYRPLPSRRWIYRALPLFLRRQRRGGWARRHRSLPPHLPFSAARFGAWRPCLWSSLSPRGRGYAGWAADPTCGVERQTRASGWNREDGIFSPLQTF